MRRNSVSRRDFLHMALLTTAGISVAACQPKATEQAAVVEQSTEVASVPAEAETVTISFMGWGGPEESQGVLDLIKIFEEENPGIKVTWQHTPEDYTTKLMAMIASGTPPDTLFTDQSYYKTFCKEGLMLDIQNWLDADPEINTKTYFLQPQEDERSAYNGRWYGIGCCWVGVHLFYNTDMFAEAGIEPPSNDPDLAWTWDHFVDVCKQFTQDSQGRHPDEGGFDSNDITQWGIFYSSGGWHGESIPLLNGVQALNPKTNQYQLDDPAAIDAIQKVADLTHKHHVAPLSQNFEDLGMSTTQMLENRKLAMVMDGTYTLSWTTKINAGLGTACPPKMKQCDGMVVADVRGAMKATKYPEQAYKWVRMTGSPVYQSIFLKMGLWWPNQTSLMTPEGLKGWINERKAPGEGVHPAGYYDLVDKYQRNHTKSWVCPPGYQEAAQIMGAGLENVWNGTQTAEQAIKGAIGQANEVLAKENS